MLQQQKKTKRSSFRTSLAVELARAGLNQSGLAAKVGVPATSLSGWLSGAYPAPADLTKRIERALKLRHGTLPTTHGAASGGGR